MIERMPNAPKPPDVAIEVDSIVVLREDLPEATIRSLAPQVTPGIKYRVTEVNKIEDSGGDSAYIVPADETEIPPEFATHFPFPLAVKHLRRLLN